MKPMKLAALTSLYHLLSSEKYFLIDEDVRLSELKLDHAAMVWCVLELKHDFFKNIVVAITQSVMESCKIQIVWFGCDP